MRLTCIKLMQNRSRVLSRSVYTSVMEFTSLLRKVYHLRTTQNSSYSIRAFARDLGVDQSVVTRVMGGKRKPSVKLIEQVSVVLGLPAKDILRATQVARGAKGSNLPEYRDLSIDHFIVTSDSCHDAILELIDTADFVGDASWIARRLSMPVNKVKSAIDRLLAVEHLKIENGVWSDVSKYTQIHPVDDNCVELKKYQRQVLDESAKALASLSIKDRSHTSMTFSASREKLPELKKLVARFRKEALALMESSTHDKTDVFQLHVGVFPLTQDQGDQV